MVAPHFSHFGWSLVALGSRSDRGSESVIAMSRFLLRVTHRGNGSRRPRRQGLRRFVRLRRAADCDNAVAYCAAVFSPLRQRFPTPRIIWRMTLRRVRL